MYFLLLVAAVVTLAAGRDRSCPANERYLECGTACPRTCVNRNNPPGACVAMCVMGCFCNEGFMRNAQGQCVKEDDCEGKARIPLFPTKSCKANEQFVTCGSACPLTCENRNNRPVACTMQCVIGCQCKPGYLKHKDGRCVKESQCDEEKPVKPVHPIGCSKPNQVFQECGSVCEEECHKKLPLACPAMCKRGCFCAPGFVKTPTGDCVRPENCPQVRPVHPIGCAKPNQVFKECGSVCEEECGKKLPLACPLMCKRGCFCSPGFVKSSNGDCVKRENCNNQRPSGKQCTKVNEIFSPCSSHCEGKCGLPENRPCNRMCKPGCACQKGFFRDSNGECVRRQECNAERQQKCTKVNEVFSPCSSHCEGKCGLPLIRPCVAMCKPGCACQQGFFRDSNGECVRRQQCRRSAESECNQANERFSPCASHCEGKCGLPENRPCNRMCVPGCACNRGFFRNSQGKCVSPNQCEKSHINEFYETGTLGNGKREVCSNDNEEFSGCAAHCEGKCGLPINRPCPYICKPGCACKQNFFRNTAGKCVERQNCDQKSMNSFYKTGTPGGSNRQCDVARGEVFTKCNGLCDSICGEMVSPRCYPKKCFSGCICKPGFARNKIGVCINRMECPNFNGFLKRRSDDQPSCPKPNEYSTACNGHCVPTCRNKTPACTKICVPGCTCRNGYYKNDSGVCVPESQC